MYVEISPRQSGKTTRLIEAVITYLNRNPQHNVAILCPRIALTKHIRNKILNTIGNSEFFRIHISTSIEQLRGLTVHHYFFDEFSQMEPRHITFNREIIGNAYYCTTPTDKQSTINMITNYCLRNNININYFNPWTETRIREQEGFDGYVREHVLEYWRNYMLSIGLDIKPSKENWIFKNIKKHFFV